MFSFFKKKHPFAFPASDMHNHILPGVDDGFHTQEDSLAALRLFSEQGVHDITFTPHLNPDVFPNTTEQHLRDTYASFAQAIPAELALTTRLAAEYMVVNGFERRVAEHADELLCFPDKSILIEQSYLYPSRNLDETVFELTMAGFRPILAHPERYLYMADSLNDFEKLTDAGCRLQLNYMSLSGTYGPNSVRIMKHLLSHGMYSFCSSDLHSVPQFHNILSLRLDSGLWEQFSAIPDQFSLH